MWEARQAVAAFLARWHGQDASMQTAVQIRPLQTCLWTRTFPLPLPPLEEPTAFLTFPPRAIPPTQAAALCGFAGGRQPLFSPALLTNNNSLLLIWTDSKHVALGSFARQP